jgi:lysophospholipase L1-like esterase
VNGKVVLLSIGMSNTTQEFRAFMRLAAGDSELNPALKLVDGALGGWDARRAGRPGSAYWSAVDRRLAAVGALPREVQAVWLKEAISGEDRPFPQDAQALRTNLRKIAQILARRFPNLRLIYTSSRTYGGYAVTPLNPEPAAYHSGYAVRWLVQDRIAGRLKGPWVGWGPYLWTDGERGRADGLIWVCDDVRKDGTHPSPAGAAKVARMLLQFFKTDATSKTWFLA